MAHRCGGFRPLLHGSDRAQIDEDGGPFGAPGFVEEPVPVDHSTRPGPYVLDLHGVRPVMTPGLPGPSRRSAQGDRAPWPVGLLPGRRFRRYRRSPGTSSAGACPLRPGRARPTEPRSSPRWTQPQCPRFIDPTKMRWFRVSSVPTVDSAATAGLTSSTRQATDARPGHWTPRSDAGVTVAEIEMNSTPMVSWTIVLRNGRSSGTSTPRRLVRRVTDPQPRRRPHPGQDEGPIRALYRHRRSPAGAWAAGDDRFRRSARVRPSPRTSEHPASLLPIFPTARLVK